MSSTRRNYSQGRLFASLMVLLIVSNGCASNDSHPATAPASSLPENVAENTIQAQTDTNRAVSLIKSHSYREAQAMLERAIAADPMYGPAHNDLGLVHYYQAEVYPAAVEYRNAVKLMPREPQPLNNLGLVLELAGKYHEAEQFYAQALALDPDNTEYAGNLARTRVRLGEHDKALTELLAKIVLYDQRPDWTQWAQAQLLKQNQATTLPLSIP